jgi:hypothetical protein
MPSLILKNKLTFFMILLEQFVYLFELKRVEGILIKRVSIVARSRLGHPKDSFVALGGIKIKLHERFESHERYLECYIIEIF